MRLFYTPDISSEIYTLIEEESKHCINVLRLSLGDKVNLIDGQGGFYETEIIEAHPKRCKVKVLSKKTQYGERNFFLHLAVAPTKNIERFEWFLEKATEIGIDEISPISCQHSERTVVKIDRLNKIITSAIKQSLKAYHPLLNETIEFKKIVSQYKEFKGRKFIAHCLQVPPDSNLVIKIGERDPYTRTPLSISKMEDELVYLKGESVLILIGPEGDFSLQEVTFALQNGFVPISLGNSRLRTETAALVACHTMNLINEQ